MFSSFSIPGLFLFVVFFPCVCFADHTDLDWDVGVGHQGMTHITVGETIHWTWTDSLPHTVSSSDGGFTGSPTMTGIGNTFSVTFNTIGSFPYECDIHPSMHGIIVVEADPVPIASLNCDGIMCDVYSDGGSILNMECDNGREGFFNKDKIMTGAGILLFDDTIYFYIGVFKWSGPGSFNLNWQLQGQDGGENLVATDDDWNCVISASKSPFF